MKLFRLLTVLFLMFVCTGQLNAETPVPEGHLRISIINDTDVVMCHNTYWLNHNIPRIYGPMPVCGGEIQPGESHTFDRDITSWHFEGTRIYGTSWFQCGSYEADKKYNSKVVSEIPEDTAIIKIYTKHYEAIPR